MTTQVPVQITEHARHGDYTPGPNALHASSADSQQQERVELFGAAVSRQLLLENPGDGTYLMMADHRSARPHVGGPARRLRRAGSEIPGEDSSCTPNDRSVSPGGDSMADDMNDCSPTQAATPKVQICETTATSLPSTPMSLESPRRGSELMSTPRRGSDLASTRPNSARTAWAWQSVEKDLIAAKAERFTRVGSRGLHRRGVPPKQAAPLYSLMYNPELSGPASLVAVSRAISPPSASHSANMVSSKVVTSHRAKQCRPLTAPQRRKPLVIPTIHRGPATAVDFSGIDLRIGSK